MINWPKQRAWGWYATLIRTPWFCLKLLRFKPNGQLSMQRHQYRTEIWAFINATGQAKESCKEHGYYKITFKNGWGLWIIRPNKWHKFTALDKPVYAIELQYGKKVTESDIERK